MILHQQTLTMDYSEPEGKEWPGTCFRLVIFRTNEEMINHTQRYCRESDFVGDARAICLMHTEMNKVSIFFALDTVNPGTVAHEVTHAIINYAAKHRRRISKWHWVGMLLRAQNPSIVLAEEFLADLAGHLTQQIYEALERQVKQIKDEDEC